MRKKNKNIKKIGILGGTFDPPHIGHLHISKIAIKKLKLNKVVWLITKRNPLKHKPYLSLNIRIKLSKEIINNQKKISVKYIDKITKSSNTYNMLTYFKNKNKSSKLFFLLGSDSLINFHKWKNWLKIPKIAKVIVFPRSKYSSKAMKSTAAKKLNKNELTYINSKKINISSSLIRKF